MNKAICAFGRRGAIENSVVPCEELPTLTAGMLHDERTAHGRHGERRQMIDERERTGEGGLGIKRK